MYQCRWTEKGLVLKESDISKVKETHYHGEVFHGNMKQCSVDVTCNDVVGDIAQSEISRWMVEFFEDPMWYIYKDENGDFWNVWNSPTSYRVSWIKCGWELAVEEGKLTAGMEAPCRIGCADNTLYLSDGDLGLYSEVRHLTDFDMTVLMRTDFDSKGANVALGRFELMFAALLHCIVPKEAYVRYSVGGEKYVLIMGDEWADVLSVKEELVLNAAFIDLPERCLGKSKSKRLKEVLEWTDLISVIRETAG